MIQNHNHIINGSSVNLRMLTDRELKQLIRGQEARLDLLRVEHFLLIEESIRRSDLPEWRHVPDPLALF